MSQSSKTAPTMDDMSATPADYLARIDGLQTLVEALRRDNWRLIAEKAARDAPPDKWLPLKAASIDVAVEYENLRSWCCLGVVVAEKRGGRWFCRMNSLNAHVAALRGK